MTGAGVLVFSDGPAPRLFFSFCRAGGSDPFPPSFPGVQMPAEETPTPPGQHLGGLLVMTVTAEVIRPQQADDSDSDSDGEDE